MAVSRTKKKNLSKKPAASKSRAAPRSAAASRTAAAKRPKKIANPLGLEKKAPDQFDTLQEIALTAYRKMPAPVWDHLMGGADSEMTLRRNRAGLDALALRQRVLVDVRNIDMSTTLLGQKLDIPVFPAPVGGFLSKVHHEGGPAVARAAVSRGTTAFIATAAKPSLEAAQAAVDRKLVFQLYVRGDRGWVENILDRVKAAGYAALCVTVDRNFYGRRERDIISGLPVKEGFGDQSYQASLNWKDLLWMKERVGLPLIAKGIATAEDAELAVEHGADVVYVSNHGGRQLDHAQGSIEVLAEVVKAVAGRAEVLSDGGVQRGTDVVKMLCLGARAVGVGKLLGLALSANGEAGVARMLELMEVEIRHALGLMGVTSIRQLGPEWLREVPVLGTPSSVSAYPLLEAALRNPRG
ncbi:MAG: alpha-hydroxy-acid oxidizing protein [Burkholderiales bacterium]|nr:alpha-hydroxy-acid oxidizing protein [Burkholderiales bacterium]